MTALRFYTTESIGTNRHLTPEGYLLCTSVPIARTGILFYQNGEIPVEGDQRGQIRIQRIPEEVFHPNAILSFAGKPITDSHPPEAVGPDNFRSYSMGVVLDPHQGNPAHNEDSTVLYADLLVQDQSLIHDVMKGRREVSAGYDAQYEQLKPGEGIQHLILGNHVAIVSRDARGRCGPMCSIGDSTQNYMTGDSFMAKRTIRQPSSWRNRIIQRFHTGDEEGLVMELDKVSDMLGDTDPNDSPNAAVTDDDGSGATHIHVHTAGSDAGSAPASPTAASPPGDTPDPAAAPGAAPGGAAGGPVTLESLAARIDNLEQAIAILISGEEDEDDPNADPNADPDMGNGPNGAPNPTDDSRSRTTDSRSLQLAATELFSRAEVLAPGLKHPTFDSKNTTTTLTGMDSFRRRALAEAIKQNGDGGEAVLAILGGRPPESMVKMTTDEITYIFNGASGAMLNLGNRGRQPAGSPKAINYGGGDAVLSVAETVANINAKNREMYGKTH
jgi:uncharacterized protein